MCRGMPEIWYDLKLTLWNFSSVELNHYLQCVIAIFSLCQYVLQFIVVLQRIAIWMKPKVDS